MTHWKKLANKNFLGSWDIEDGKDLVLTIKHAYQEEVDNSKGQKEECLLIDFEEADYKPMILNNTNANSIEKATGTPYIENWAGKKIALFTAKVSAFGEVVDAIRIRQFAPAPKKEYFCEECGKKIEGYANMSDEAVSEYTKKKYGKSLCTECARKEAEK